MVERLKAAIERARQTRTADPLAQAGATSVSPAPARSEVATGDVWAALPEAALDRAALVDRRLLTSAADDPAAAAFDMLRGQLLKLCADRGWRRIGVTSPRKGAGKTTLIGNMAMSLMRAGVCRTVVVDLDLRASRLAGLMSIEPPGDVSAVLTGETPAVDAAVRCGDNVALLMNRRLVPSPASIMHRTNLERMIGAIDENLRPDLLLFDLPPILSADEAIPALDVMEGALLVAAAGETRAKDVEASERLITPSCPLIGLVFNKAEHDVNEDYYGTS